MTDLSSLNGLNIFFSLLPPLGGIYICYLMRLQVPFHEEQLRLAEVVSERRLSRKGIIAHGPHLLIKSTERDQYSSSAVIH